MNYAVEAGILRSAVLSRELGQPEVADALMRYRTWDVGEPAIMRRRLADALGLPALPPAFEDELARALGGSE